jgi:cell division protein FtsB
MRIFAVVLGLAVVLLQYRVWVSDHGVREVSRLTAAVEAQAAANIEQRERNRQLVAEVNDLKGGLTALEETFYQVVTVATPAPAAPATTITARAQ